ncbi:thioredoxin family protein [Paenibacillus sp. HB172176]|uniref:thioredoxin family protein n=1 Tax=Paenibacillus sp. HB172176 TaxID=2493690 RepID=UPI00143B5371|nr:thioredoxin family protein [Paenibacillus sp. HB172176]
MRVQIVDNEQFDGSILPDGVSLVEFGAVWCPPCKTLLPILDEIAESYGEAVAVLQVDCDESPDLASRFGVMSMPTVVVFHNGEPVNKLIGLRPRSVYEQVIERYTAASAAG